MRGGSWSNQAGVNDPACHGESTALVPVTPESLHRVLLDLEGESTSTPRASAAAGLWRPAEPAHGWKVMAWTSLAWLLVLGLPVSGFRAALERQDRQIELLLQRTAPPSLAP
jgi:hypothetical protein